MPETRQRPSRSARLGPLLSLGVIAAVVLVGAVILARGHSSAPTAGPSPVGSLATGTADLEHPDSPTLGPDDAPVTLVEFLDPECEACRAAYPVVKGLLAEYPDELRLVIRYVPGHGNSARAIVALEAAAEQGRYWDMLDALFERQPEWGERDEPQVDAFVDIARSIGLDVTRFSAALERPDVSAIERDIPALRTFGIRATPTFFVNGREVVGVSEEALRVAIRDALDDDGSPAP